MAESEGFKIYLVRPQAVLVDKVSPHEHTIRRVRIERSSVKAENYEFDFFIPGLGSVARLGI